MRDLIRHRLARSWEKTIAPLGRDLAGRDAGNAIILAFGVRVLFLTLRPRPIPQRPRLGRHDDGVTPKGQITQPTVTTFAQLGLARIHGEISAQNSTRARRFLSRPADAMAEVPDSP